METRRFITAILISLLVWMLLSRYLFPVKQQPTTAPATQSTQIAETQASTAPAASVAPNPIRNDDIVLGSEQKGSGFEMRVVLTNRGASLSRGYMSTKYSESVKDITHGYRVVEPVKYPQGERYSLATNQLLLTGAKGHRLVAELDNVQWFYKIDMTPNFQQVRFWIDVIDNGKKIFRVVKTYVLAKGSYDLKMTVSLENLSDASYNAVIRQTGPIGIRQEDRREDRKIFSGAFAPGGNEVRIGSIDRATLEKKPNMTHNLGAVDESVVWAGEVNKYFAALLAGVDKEGRLNSQMVDAVEARALTSDSKQGEDFLTVWITRSVKLAPKGKADLYFELYLGPKSATIFSIEPYLSRNYIYTFEHSWCTLQSLADFMTWLLKNLYRLTHNYGVAIILLVVIVRVVLHPITKSSQVNMMRMQREMQRLQPKLNALKEKYKGNREALNKATMELYKAEGVNPAGSMLGCLPMMLQMPIWVALWTALNNTFELRHQPFFLWIRDLAGADALISFSRAYEIPILSWMVGPVNELNVLPLIMIVSMLLQQKLSPQTAPSPDADPAQVRQQKIMMYFMSFFFGLILYNAPSGLNLYILTSNFVGIFENKRIRAHLEMEQKRPSEEKKRKSSLWSRMQDRMEKIAREYEQEKPKKGK